jgi:hypothetical protein
MKSGKYLVDKVSRERNWDLPKRTIHSRSGGVFDKMVKNHPCKYVGEASINGNHYILLGQVTHSPHSSKIPSGD